ncbi:hypothetical protein M409DRAFT_20085 [Zasmidium cellare ATCC 36951]|uniref:Protein SQS1 n=1 Tax=Zasmidium cellare ATCC 36951 TaxID=1080233 RepID=A0A6A6CU32_ZASCE|nr:uncharacterized protein M409DRAFT_20085 [Zasmidium cellare ATCC 36951]KAF2169670.1 hypothetical protein M409DRAFT_20085 [Zasmidium cellare ATCC 36951]
MGKKKGKAQNGRAKQKQKAKGSNNNTPRTPMSRDQRFARQMLLDDDWEEENPLQFRGFSQNTPASSTPRSANAKLRHQAISFVSAGVNSPSVKPPQPAEQETGDEDITLDDSDEGEFDDEDIDDGAIQTNIIMDADIELSEQGVAKMNIAGHNADMMEIDTGAIAQENSHTVPEQDVSFVVDTVGDASLAGKQRTNASRPPKKRSPSPAPSDSSEEVVVFHGRNRGQATIIDDPVTQTPPQQAPAPPKASSPHITDDLLNALKAPTPGYSPAFPEPSRSSLPVMGWGARPSKYGNTAHTADGWTPAPENPYWKKGKGKAVPRPDLAPSAAKVKAFEQSGPRESKVKFSQQATSENTEKSLDTLKAEWKATLRENKQQKKSRRGKGGRKTDNRAMRNIIISSDEEDGGGSEAAYEDYMENLKAQLEAEGEESVMDVLKESSSHSRSIAGPSMVVDGQEFGEDEVLPKHMKGESGEAGGSGELDGDSNEWETSESEMNPDFNEISSDESLNASDLEEELEYTERQQWEDEDDLRQRRIDRMTDEQIARLLAKQEELGMEGDELLLEDGAYDLESDDGFGDLQAARAGLSDITNSTFARAPKKHGMRRNKSQKDPDFFPDATMLADTLDQYGDNGFDIMDYDRPSLRPTKKGRKGKLPPELEMLSDEELKEEMRGQWANDRSKKREKKLEREELRREGLLGSAGRKGKPDLSARYPLGMTLKEVHNELREFLQDEDLHQRAFPPMDKINRKSLHEVCTALNLKSKSQGAGKNRFPIIYKTSMTLEYSDDMFGRVLNASNHGFLTNAKAKKMSKQLGKRAGRGGGFSQAATGLRDGEIVGAGAAEIGQNNFGHRMMEKMGWTKGAGLGKDGEGRLHHVEQVMRTSKAGLG